MPIYPGRRAGTWRVTVWAQKRQHEEIVEGTRRDAREVEAKLRLERRSQSSPTRRRIEPALPVFCAEEYEPHARARLGSRTWSTRSSILATICAFFGELRPSEITLGLVGQFTTCRLKSTRPSTVNHELAVLSALLRFAREDCAYPVPIIRIRRLAEEERRVHVWTPAEQARLLQACSIVDRDLKPLIVFLLQTGVRKTEAVRAPWAWLQRRGKHPVLFIGPTDAWAPKSKRPREIPVTNELQRLLDRLPRTSAVIFPRPDGERYQEFPSARFRHVVKAAKLRGGPHTCRHSFASRFLDAGGSLQDLAALLGHTLTRTTELYVHLLPTHLERARSVLNATARLPSPAKAAG